MASRLKEDERNERIIRGLLKNSENKRCINCNSLGPQYVCTTFWTFICTNCSGIHREFTHRVKSISMSKFTSQEVTALQEGGNQRAKEIYFKGLDPQRQSLPDGSNVERLRDFIRHVYVNKRYMTEKDDKPPTGKMGGKNDFQESRSPGGSRSPPYEDAYEHQYGDRSSPGGRSPGFEPGSKKFGEFVNDWRRDDRFGSGRKSDEGSRSPEQAKDLGSPSPPVVRPVREILGDSVAPLRVGEPPKPESNQIVNASANAKRTTSSSSLVSAYEKPPEVKQETAVSLIDFDADPEPPTASATPAQTQQSTTSLPQPVVQPMGSSNDNWASFDVAPSSVNVSEAPPNGNMVDSLLSQLTVPSSTPVQTSGLPSGPSTSVNTTAFLATPVTVANFGGGNYAAPGSSISTVQIDGPSPHTSAHWPNVQHQPPSSMAAPAGHSTAQNIAPSQNGPSGNQPWNMTPPSHVQRSLSAPSLQPIQGVSQEAASAAPQPSGRKELPVDLFTAMYPSYHAPMPGWQGGPPHFMGYGMQQYAMHFQNFPQPPKSVNPFDFSNEPPHQTQTATQFPSMASVHGALPNSLPPNIMRTSSLSSASPSWMPSQAMQHPSGIPSQMPSHPSAMPPRYMSPQMPSNTPLSNLSSAGNLGSPYVTQHMDQHFGSQFLTPPPNPHSFPSGGNPFG